MNTEKFHALMEILMEGSGRRRELPSNVSFVKKEDPSDNPVKISEDTAFSEGIDTGRISFLIDFSSKKIWVNLNLEKGSKSIDIPDIVDVELPTVNIVFSTYHKEGGRWKDMGHENVGRSTGSPSLAAGRFVFSVIGYILSKLVEKYPDKVRGFTFSSSGTRSRDDLYDFLSRQIESEMGWLYLSPPISRMLGQGTPNGYTTIDIDWVDTQSKGKIYAKYPQLQPELPSIKRDIKDYGKLINRFYSEKEEVGRGNFISNFKITDEVYRSLDSEWKERLLPYIGLTWYDYALDNPNDNPEDWISKVDIDTVNVDGQKNLIKIIKFLASRKERKGKDTLDTLSEFIDKYPERLVDILIQSMSSGLESSVIQYIKKNKEKISEEQAKVLADNSEKLGFLNVLRQLLVSGFKEIIKGREDYFIDIALSGLVEDENSSELLRKLLTLKRYNVSEEMKRDIVLSLLDAGKKTKWHPSFGHKALLSDVLDRWKSESLLSELFKTVLDYKDSEALDLISDYMESVPENLKSKVLSSSWIPSDVASKLKSKFGLDVQGQSIGQQLIQLALRGDEERFRKLIGNDPSKIPEEVRPRLRSIFIQKGLDDLLKDFIEISGGVPTVSLNKYQRIVSGNRDLAELNMNILNSQIPDSLVRIEGLKSPAYVFPYLVSRNLGRIDSDELISVLNIGANPYLKYGSDNVFQIIQKSSLSKDDKINLLKILDQHSQYESPEGRLLPHFVENRRKANLILSVLED